MTEQSKMNLLFFLGVLIPALVTVGLFAVFCYCWYKIRIRNQILYKKHDPHKIERLRESGKVYQPPPPPPPPFKSNLTLFQESLSYNNNNVKKTENDNYEESPEPTEGIVNMVYKTNGDSGFSDLNHIQCDVNNSGVEVQRPVSDGLRPNSQASDDSDDSGFRSSRSGQYIHSASDSAGNPHDLYPHGGVSSLQVHDTVPLFKPIKIHPNEFGQNPLVSYMHRNSSSSKYRNNRGRKPPSSSPGFYNMGSESHHQNRLNAIYHIDQQPLNFPPLPHRNSVPQGGRHNCNTRHISLSNYDVHGGRLHSIDSHYGPLASPGHYGTRSTLDSCGHPRSQSMYGDEIFHRADSLGYGSVCDSSLGYIPNTGQQQHSRPIHSEQMYQPPQTSHFTTQNPFPLSTNISGGYMISNTSHMRPIQPDVSIHKMNEPLQTVPEASIPLTVTQAMVHRPYIEELSDPSLYSVV